MAIENRNWFRRHWIVSIMLGFVVIIMIGIVFDTDDNSNLTGNVVNEQNQQERVISNTKITEVPIDDLFFDLNELGPKYDKELGYGWKEGDLHESGYVQSGIKKELGKWYGYEDSTGTELREKELEISAMEFYSEDTALEYFEKLKSERGGPLYGIKENYSKFDLDYGDYSFGEIQIQPYHLKTRQQMLIVVVKGKYIIWFVYSSNFDEDVGKVTLNYTNQILDKFIKNG